MTLEGAELDDLGLVDLLLAEEYGSLLWDRFWRPRRFALACGQGWWMAPIFVGRRA